MADKAAEPFAPLQRAAVAVALGTTAAGSVIVTATVPVHPLPSVAVMVYVPAGAVSVLAEMLPPVEVKL